MIVEFCGVVLCLFLLLNFCRNETKNLPPGPWGLPLVGHLIFLGTKPHLTLMEWKKKYGSIIYCRFGSFGTVVLNDAKLIRQTFNMSEFSGRPELQTFIQAANKKGIVFSEASHNQEQRQFAMRNLRDFGMGKKTMESKIQDDLLDFLKTIKKNEGSSIKCSRLANANMVSTIWTILMTDKLDLENFHYLAGVIQEKVNQLGSYASQFAFFMPWLETLVKFLTCGRISLIKERVDAFKETYRFINNQLTLRKESWIKNDQRDLADAYFDQMDETTNIKSSFHEKHNFCQYFFGDLFMAGIETTSVSIEWALNYLVRDLKVQRKLQKEIDTVVGSSRLPSLSDRPNMPYTDAILYEVLRCSSILPLAVPHRTLTDLDNFHGYHIPKNTMVFANLYAVHYDPEVWGDPENFRPERWLVKTKAEAEQVKKLKSENFLVFSYGKRVCLGASLARDQLFLYITTIFQKYNVSFVGEKKPPFDLLGAIGRLPAPVNLVFNARC